MTSNVEELVIGILGGTGDQGRGLANRFARAGHQVIIGSRSEERAREAAEELAGTLPGGSTQGGSTQGGSTQGGSTQGGSAQGGTAHGGSAQGGSAQGGSAQGGSAQGGSDQGGTLQGMTNAEASRAADVVIAAVPWEGHAALLTSLAAELAGKIVIDCVNPLGFDAKGAFALPVAEGSAAEQAASVLPDSTVVAAFHHVSAKLLLDAEVETVDLDVLVLGDNREATDLVQALAARIPGVRGVYAGRLRNAGQVEAFTANLVSVNRRYKAHAGLRITDI
jgi:NADPH-dependent F420 reductase